MTRPERRHDRRLSDAQRDERVKLDVDPEDALRHLLGVDTEDEPPGEDAVQDSGPGRRLAPAKPERPHGM